MVILFLQKIRKQLKTNENHTFHRVNYKKERDNIGKTAAQLDRFKELLGMK